MKVRSRLVLLILCFGMSTAWANSTRIFTLSADQWAQPRSGALIPEFAAVRSAMNYWARGPGAMIMIRYPGEDSGELWAAELKDWLISLGVPGDYIELTPGNQDADEIRLIVGNKIELDNL